MKKVVWAVLLGIGASSSALFIGCNNGSCDYVSKCAADPTPSENDITLCNNKKDDPKCGGLYNDYLACFQSNQVCTTSGVTDMTITDGTCGDQYNKWVTCYYGVDGSAYDGQ
jgi:hypothetical protein